jgi:poly-beta-1,6-N-acetyl-D-glucosamine synthase
MLDYVLLTAARNEAAYIGLTLKAVTTQTVQPLRWTIVSDGSTDATDRLVSDCAAAHPFIRLSRAADADGNRNFGSKAKAINAAYAELRAEPFDLVGIVDADVSFGPDYYAQLMPHFEADTKLGIAGGRVLDNRGGAYVAAKVSFDWSVRGPIQMFRRACFEAIGGYRALSYGGIDAMAEVMARMHGWTVRTIPSLEVRHHRRTGTAAQGKLKALFRVGCQNYVNGYHPFFMFARCLYRMSEHPVLVNGLTMLLGYLWAATVRLPREVPDDIRQFLRREQMARLRGKT